MPQNLQTNGRNADILTHSVIMHHHITTQTTVNFINPRIRISIIPT